jgi:hypothetical protein
MHPRHEHQRNKHWRHKEKKKKASASIASTFSLCCFFLFYNRVFLPPFNLTRDRLRERERQRGRRKKFSPSFPLSLFLYPALTGSPTIIMAAAAIPDAFLCPITLEIMTDPVVDNAGHSYEREAIMACLAKKAESPITRNPLTADQLSPNYALRDLIQQFNKDRHQAVIANNPVAPPPLPAIVDPRSMRLSSQVSGANVLVRIQPPPGDVRTPSVIVCLVDCSESTEMDVTIKDKHGHEAGHGLCVLDLIKHALHTIIAMLGPDDTLAIVSFNHRARVLLPPCIMDAAAKVGGTCAVRSHRVRRFAPCASPFPLSPRKLCYRLLEQP